MLAARRGLLALAATFLAVMTTSALSAPTASAAPQDPGAFCRAPPSFPYSGGYTVNKSNETYTATYYAEGSITCNGPTKITVTVQLVHHATDAAGTVVDSGTTQGNTSSCNSGQDEVCNESAAYVRSNFSCGVEFNYDDYTRVVGTWVNPSNGQTYSISGESGHSTGSSYNPPSC